MASQSLPPPLAINTNITTTTPASPQTSGFRKLLGRMSRRPSAVEIIPSTIQNSSPILIDSDLFSSSNSNNLNNQNTIQISNALELSTNPIRSNLYPESPISMDNNNIYHYQTNNLNQKNINNNYQQQQQMMSSSSTSNYTTSEFGNTSYPMNKSRSLGAGKENYRSMSGSSSSKPSSSKSTSRQNSNKTHGSSIGPSSSSSSRQQSTGSHSIYQGSPSLSQSAGANQQPPSPSPSSTGSSATRFLRRVASAPNTKALFSGSFFSSSSSVYVASTKNGFLSPNGTSVPPLPVGIIPVGDLSDSYNHKSNPNSNSNGVYHSSNYQSQSNKSNSQNKTPKTSTSTTKSSSGSNRSSSAPRSRSSPSLVPPSPSFSHSHFPSSSSTSLSPPSPNPSQTGPNGSPRLAFRRTYSSSSIRVRSVEIGPSSFHKIKLLGKGDVGKVYLVKEKKTEKLFAMKVLSKKEMIKRNKIKRALAEQVSSIS